MTRAEQIHAAIVELLPFSHAGLTVESATAEENVLTLTGHGGIVDPEFPGDRWRWRINNPPLCVVSGEVDPVAAFRAIVEDHP